MLMLMQKVPSSYTADAITAAGSTGSGNPTAVPADPTITKDQLKFMDHHANKTNTIPKKLVQSNCAGKSLRGRVSVKLCRQKYKRESVQGKSEEIGNNVQKSNLNSAVAAVIAMSLIVTAVVRMKCFEPFVAV